MTGIPRLASSTVVLSLLGFASLPAGADPHNESTDWLRNARYGVFVHFLPADAAGLDRVDDFDVAALAGQLDLAGAKYFVITLGQNSGYFIAPNAAYDRRTGYAPGERCSRRDLPLDLHEALSPKGIGLMLYLPCQTPNRDRHAQKAFGLPEGPKDQPIDLEFAGQWATVIQEWSDRYGDKVAGWWFDGAYQHVRFDEAIGRLYADAVKHGNPRAIVTFNPGVRLIHYSQAEDYTAGELNDPFETVPTSRWLEGSQWHALTYLGSSWGRRDTRHPDGRWVTWVKSVVEHGGVVTLDMGPNWDPEAGPIGSLDQAQVRQVQAIRTALGEPEYDAAFVGMTVPEKVEATEVFPVAIIVRNTGTETWEGPSYRLRPAGAPGSDAWGTDFILIAQGTAVRPGDEYAFRSHLRAPVQAGAIGFQWRVVKDGAFAFGESTPARTLEVLPRPKDAGGAEAARERSASGRKILTFADFDYLGSFKPPKTVGEARGAFSECGLAVRPRADGRDRLILNYTHPAQVLFEVEIPELVRVEGGEHADLNAAEVAKLWGSVSVSTPGEAALSPNGGFAWLAERQTLVWTWYHGYKTGPAPPVLGATRLPDDGEMTSEGPWRISAPGGLYKSYWGGVIALPPAFAERYTGGKTLALGFGGYYSICASASRGPALGVIPSPTAEEASVPVTPLLYYPHDEPAARDGDYFNANCGYWSDQPTGPNRGTWTYDDACRAGAFIETPSGHAYVAFVRLGTGRLGYDYGTITSAGASESWYVYDPEELGEAAAGKRPPWKTAPVARTKVRYPLGRTITGAAFDRRTRRLYLCASWAYPDGLESYPIVHVYGVR